MRKNNLGFLFFFVAVILIIPAFAFVGQSPAPAPADDQSRPAVPDALTEKDYENNNFYRIQNHKTGEVMSLTPADYIKGVVAAEMPASYHSEALKAQAVAAHTYALRQIDAELKEPDESLNGAYLSTDPDHFQAYLSVDEMKDLWGNHFEVYYKKLSDAVDAVIDEAITYENEPIIAAFHSISGGTTESAENVWGQPVNYLKPVDSEGDELSPDYETGILLKQEEVSHALTQKYPDIQLGDNPAEWFSITSRSDSGTVLELTAGNRTMSGRELRELLKLKSANFTLSYENGSFAFDTLGAGHGVGMSQYGADYLARQGKSYREILTHYYTGVSIVKISEADS